MTPELTLSGGFAGSLGNIGYGYDGSCNCYYTDNADVYSNPGDTTQMRLSYASGPLSFAVALEDASGAGGSWGDGHVDRSCIDKFGDDLGVAAEVKYSGDTISGEIAGTWRGKPNTSLVGHLPDTGHLTTNTNAFWQVGAGLGFALGDMASLSFAANIGELNHGADFWNVNGLISANLSDTVHGEVGAGYKEYNRSSSDAWSNLDSSTWGVLAGLYYDPVDQLTIGLEGEWTETTQGHNNATDTVIMSAQECRSTWFRFGASNQNNLDSRNGSPWRAVFL